MVSPITRIKVCGITSVEDAQAAVAAGAEALGLVFYSKSPRAVTIQRAQEIAQSLPPFITLVGLFVDASDNEIETVLETVPLTLIQFHGNEKDSDCQRWGVRYIKAIRVKPGLALEQVANEYPGASALLLDAYRKGVPGGTGEVFDWQLIPANLPKPVILAGGLHPGNVRAAIQAVSPYALDVSSGVERVPGVKDHGKISAFFEASGR